MVDAARAIEEGGNSGLKDEMAAVASSVDVEAVRPVFSLYFDELPASVANNPVLESSIGDLLDRANDEPVYERGAQIFVNGLHALGFENTGEILRRIESGVQPDLKVVETQPAPEV